MRPPTSCCILSDAFPHPSRSNNTPEFTPVPSTRRGADAPDTATLHVEQVVLPFKLLVTLVPICGGVALATANDTEVSAEGAFWALAGLLAAAGYQILVKSTQDNLQVPLFAPPLRAPHENGVWQNARSFQVWCNHVFLRNQTDVF